MIVERTVRVGPRSAPSSAEDWEELGPAAFELVAGDSAEEGLIPIPLALLLQELDEDDGSRELLLRSRIPAGVTEDDVDVLQRWVRSASLPPPTPLTLRVLARGLPGQPGFHLETDWRDFDGRPLSGHRKAQVDGLWGLEGGDGAPYRLSLGQWEILERLNAGDPPGSEEGDYRWLAAIQAAVPEGDEGVAWDSFLEREKVEVVENIRPRLAPVPGGTQVRPVAAEVPSRDLEDYFYNTPPSALGEAPLVRRSEGARRNRVVFGPKAKRALHRSRELDELDPEDTAAALSNPEATFGDDFDLSQFSERVTGLGPRVVRSFPSLKEIDSKQWWEWDVRLELEDVDFEDEPAGTSALPASKGKDPPPGVSLKDPVMREKLRGAIATAERRGSKYVPLPNGTYVEITRELKKALEAAEQLEAESVDGRLARRPKLVLQVLDNVEALLFDPDRPPPPPAPRRIPPPAGLVVPMLEHQEEGFQWLASLADPDGAEGESWKGALLADDMGLGKTFQALALMVWLREQRNDVGPFLVVAPVGLLENWRAEASRFVGASLEPVIVAHGSYWKSSPEEIREDFRSAGLVLTSYGTLRAQEMVFAPVRWEVMILDEAQKGKDPATQTARVVRAMSARFRLAVTGTPVENTLKELWTIYDWAAPGLLKTLREFGEDFLKPLRTADNAGRERLSQEIYRLIGPVFMRRMKRKILRDRLPEISHHRSRVPLSPEQTRKYAAVGQRMDSEGKQIIGILHRFFGVCAHPAYRGRGVLPSLEEHPFPKGEALFGILDQIRASQEKVVVFARWKTVQRWIADEAEYRYRDESRPREPFRVEIVNGDVTGSIRRLKIIEDFSKRSGFGVLVLAPRAAGVGLNITAANHVVHYTREWNPAVEDQATDRVYRMGQTRPVHVYTLTSTSELGTTVEERLDELLEEKRALFQDFVVPLGGFELDPRQLAGNG